MVVAAGRGAFLALVSYVLSCWRDLGEKGKAWTDVFMFFSVCAVLLQYDPLALYSCRRLAPVPKRRERVRVYPPSLSRGTPVFRNWLNFLDLITSSPLELLCSNPASLLRHSHVFVHATVRRVCWGRTKTQADIFCFSVGLNVLQEDALALYAYGRVPLKVMSRDLEQAGGLAGGQETTLSLSHGTSEFLE